MTLEIAATSSPWSALASRVLDGHVTTPEEAEAILNAPSTEILDLLAAAYRLRHAHYGNRVALNYLLNARNGRCPEDCGYCAQSAHATAAIDDYGLRDHAEIVAGADRAAALNAGTCCIVLSGRGPDDRDVDRVTDAIREIKERHPGLRICACLGLLEDDQAERLAAAGADRYNHNLNTSERRYDQICTTHTYADRVRTVESAKRAGISPCSGVIVGMGETARDVVASAVALRRLDADSIPVNFLLEIEGTPLAHDDAVRARREDPAVATIDPRYALKVLCMFRFVNPTKEIRVSAGREAHLRTLQPMALYAANAIFVGDYLTEPGQAPDLDRRMIEDLGFTWEEA